VAELFGNSIAAGRQCRAVAMLGGPGSGRHTALLELARSARLGGYIPIIVDMLRPDTAPLVEGRSLALFVRSNDADGWRSLLRGSLISPRPHIVVLLNGERVRGVRHVVLERLSPNTLAAAIQPSTLPARIAERITRAARRAHGRPGRF